MMSTLTIQKKDQTITATFEAPAKLQQVLESAGVLPYHPCGGRGVCGKCAVTLTGNVSPMNPAEQKAGTYLTCQATLLGDATATLGDQDGPLVQIESTKLDQVSANNPMPGQFGAAIDIGTTTVVLQLFELHSGQKLAEASERNKQIAVSADVMGRIGAAIDGKLHQLSQLIRDQILSLLKQACSKASIDETLVKSMVITGNTTMLYLLTERDPMCLSRAPFIADTLFGQTTEFLGRTVYFPPCMSAFVGADITCAVLASGMYNLEETSLLCDVGTNGEMALWKNGKLGVCSTAAGPAFEGEGISCGCSDIAGAIDEVHVENNKLVIHTLQDAPAVGICGSGLIDAVASLLEVEELDETGYLEDDYELAENVALEPGDIRAVQLAKAAIAAGVLTLIENSQIIESDIRRLYLAGGFGNHLNVQNAARIGLFPEELVQCATPIGNAALSGAVMLLLNQDNRAIVDEMMTKTTTVALGGDPKFNQHYVDQMFFPELD